MPASDLDRIVALSHVPNDAAGYVLPRVAGISLPELPDSAAPTVALAAVRQLFQIWGLDRPNQNTALWNPLADFISPASRIAIKPNWVYHAPQGPATLEALITHTSVIQAVLEYVALTSPAAITVGDAPLQSCDFHLLREAAGLGSLEAWARERNIPLEIVDFRRTVNPDGRPAAKRREDVRPMDRFVLFDLGDESALQPLDADAGKFRVTEYDPDRLTAAHHRGSHKYLIAREVLDADVVLNIPKLKCHMKACITGALKNLVGINGHKEYLPHHRKGGSDSGGDCYPGAPSWKGLTEDVADFVNREQGSRSVRYALGRALAASRKLAAFAGADDNVEGAWYGNDTVWRMCLDLNRILLYGSSDGRLQSTRQRTLINITDAIVAGEGEGPLKPTPVAAGFLTGALNPAVAEYVHARLMGFDPERIPLIRRAFDPGARPLVDFSPADIRVLSALGETPGTEVRPIRRFTAPVGWRGHCELRPENVPHEAHLASV